MSSNETLFEECLHLLRKPTVTRNAVVESLSKLGRVVLSAGTDAKANAGVILVSGFRVEILDSIKPLTLNQE